MGVRRRTRRLLVSGVVCMGLLAVAPLQQASAAPVTECDGVACEVAGNVGTAVHVDGGFTLNELVAHSMEKSYGPGLAKLVPQSALRVRSAAIAAANFPQEVLVGREP